MKPMTPKSACKAAPSKAAPSKALQGKLTPTKMSSAAHVSSSRPSTGKTPPSKTASSKAVTSKSLLRDLEKLSSQNRWRRVVEMGRAASAGGDGCEELKLLISFSQSSIPYERMVAAMGLRQTACVTEIEKLAKDPYDCIASLAMMPVAKLLSNEALLRLFDELPQWRLSMLCSQLEREGKLPMLVDSYLTNATPEAKNGPALRLLCWASGDVLAAQSCSALRCLTKKEWKTLTRRCPNFASTFVQNEIKSGVVSGGAATRAHVVLRAMRRHHPSVGVKLLEAVLQRTKVESSCLVEYARMYPAVVAELVLKHKVRRAFEGWSFLKKLSPDVLLQLFDENALCYDDFTDFFVNSTRNVRELLYVQRRQSLLQSNGAIHSYAIECIPAREDRDREALRALTEVEELRLDPREWVAYLSTLPFPRVSGLGAQHLRSQDVHIRAAACCAVVKGGRFYEEHLDDVLDFCVARVNECDPVRREIIFHLSCLPPSRWKKHHMPKLLSIIESACDAKDVSGGTLEWAVSLVMKTALFDHELIDSTLLSLLRRDASISDLPASALPKSTVAHVWSTLLPWMTKKLEKEDNYDLTRVLYNFGSRLRDVEESAVPFLKRLCDSSSPDLVEFGVTALLEYFRPTALAMLPERLAASPDWININGVRDAVSVSLPGEVLEKYLVPQQLHGRFAGDKTATLPVFKDGYRWTASKQQTYAKSIANLLLHDDHKGMYERPMICALSVLYSGNVMEAIRPFFAEGYKRAYLRKMMLDLLGSLHDTASMDLLKSFLDGEHASDAVYAIRRRIRGLPPTEVVELLNKAAHSKKVSVQKEAVRIIGDAGGEDVYVFLRKLRQETKLHTDVEIAWLRAMQGFVEKREVWNYFYDAAKNKISALAVAVATVVPEDALEEEWQHENIAKLLLLLLSHEDPSVKIAALTRLSKSPLRYHSPEVVEQLYSILQSSTQGEFLSLTLHALIVSHVEPSDIAACVANVPKDPWLSDVAEVLETLGHTVHERVGSVTVELVNTLLQNRRQPAVACRLICTLPAERLGELLEKVDQQELLHTGAALAVVRHLRFTVKSVAALKDVEKKLRNHENSCMQRIGLSLLVGIASVTQWDTGLKDILEIYCQASDQWVSDEAKLVQLPPQS